MQIYLVGGAVRDELLGLPIKDRDWLVVGSTPEHLLELGYQQVGQDFPVFLHPQTKEEYALARTEQKSGHGYQGFRFDFNPNISIEEDLLRRDLTINAIAKSAAGELLDPYGGQQDLEDKRLRHVSEQFCEDPLRVLRVARFKARFHHLGFEIADETLELMAKLNRDGELAYLTTERVWQETERALSEPHPEQFFLSLKACGALKTLFPEIDALFGVPQTMYYHPEVDSGIHTMKVLEQAAKLSDDPQIRFAALCHDLGKATTPSNILPRHRGHEDRGDLIAQSFCKRLKTPNHFRWLASKTAKYHSHAHLVGNLKPMDYIDLFSGLDAFRTPSNLDKFLTVCNADYQGRTGFEGRHYRHVDLLKSLYVAAADVSIPSLIEQGFKGRELGEAILNQRALNISNKLASLVDSPTLA